MFVKATGPVVFSDSSDSDSDDENDGEQVEEHIQTEQDVIKFKDSDSDISDQKDSNDEQQPNKKKKMF